MNNTAYSSSVISVFDIMKVGIGPSSSHTMGPWKAAQMFVKNLEVDRVQSVMVELYGSLSKTGRGHGTLTAVQLGLSGFDYRTIATNKISTYISNIEIGGSIKLNNEKWIPFSESEHIALTDQHHPTHPNALTFRAFYNDDEIHSQTYFSVGGGFVVAEGSGSESSPMSDIPYPITTAGDIYGYLDANEMRMVDLVRANELALCKEESVSDAINALWRQMIETAYHGAHTFGVLPGGLQVVRRAPQLNRQLLADHSYTDVDSWLEAIRMGSFSFDQMIQWVSCFALATNEENAALGRIVTAPTNGAAGVVPAVLLFHHCFYQASEEDIETFLLIAGEIGSLFKKGATISAAMGGCQAEIGVSSAMAAAGLTAVKGGSCKQILMAAEIAMEHHLGLTCDPLKGLVQVPCIER
ncbi:MAG: L-serine ammonia-lyase, partial [Bacteroidota bacterium]